MSDQETIKKMNSIIQTVDGYKDGYKVVGVSKNNDDFTGWQVVDSNGNKVSAGFHSALSAKLKN